jgi:hypothetical protein
MLSMEKLVPYYGYYYYEYALQLQLQLEQATMLFLPETIQTVRVVRWTARLV